MSSPKRNRLPYSSEQMSSALTLEAIAELNKQYEEEQKSFNCDLEDNKCVKYLHISIKTQKDISPEEYKILIECLGSSSKSIDGFLYNYHIGGWPSTKHCHIFLAFNVAMRLSTINTLKKKLEKCLTELNPQDEFSDDFVYIKPKYCRKFKANVSDTASRLSTASTSVVLELENSIRYMFKRSHSGYPKLFNSKINSAFKRLVLRTVQNYIKRPISNLSELSPKDMHTIHCSNPKIEIYEEDDDLLVMYKTKRNVEAINPTFIDLRRYIINNDFLDAKTLNDKFRDTIGTLNLGQTNGLRNILPADKKYFDMSNDMMFFINRIFNKFCITLDVASKMVKIKNVVINNKDFIRNKIIYIRDVIKALFGEEPDLRWFKYQEYDSVLEKLLSSDTKLFPHHEVSMQYFKFPTGLFDAFNNCFVTDESEIKTITSKDYSHYIHESKFKFEPEGFHDFMKEYLRRLTGVYDSDQLDQLAERIGYLTLWPEHVPHKDFILNVYGDPGTTKSSLMCTLILYGISGPIKFDSKYDLDSVNQYLRSMIDDDSKGIYHLPPFARKAIFNSQSTGSATVEGKNKMPTQKKLPTLCSISNFTPISVNNPHNNEICLAHAREIIDNAKDPSFKPQDDFLNSNIDSLYGTLREKLQNNEKENKLLQLVIDNLYKKDVSNSMYYSSFDRRVSNIEMRKSDGIDHEGLGRFFQDNYVLIVCWMISRVGKYHLNNTKPSSSIFNLDDAKTFFKTN